MTRGLGKGFSLVSADWSGWDVEHEGGARIEVKQSAARQTWTDEPSIAGKPAPSNFDIRARSGYWDDNGSRWVEGAGRPAQIYILAWHPVTNIKVADHRDHRQWRFFVVPTVELPPEQKTISRVVVEQQWPSVGFDDLRARTLKTIGELDR